MLVQSTLILHHTEAFVKTEVGCTVMSSFGGLQPTVCSARPLGLSSSQLFLVLCSSAVQAPQVSYFLRTSSKWITATNFAAQPVLSHKTILLLQLYSIYYKTQSNNTKSSTVKDILFLI